MNSTLTNKYANLSPGDPARVDDHTVLNLPHEVAQVRGEKQQMWRPGTISYKKKFECEKEKDLCIVALLSNCS